MNREILFRGKRKDNSEWVYGFYEETCTCILEPPMVAYCIRDIQQRLFEVIPETVGQYTGLDDKNGKKIFENDIVKVNERYKGLGEVDFLYKVDYIDRLAKYVYNPLLINGKYDNNNNEVELYYYETNDIEVIGNIHDNLELSDKEVK